MVRKVLEIGGGTDDGVCTRYGGMMISQQIIRACQFAVHMENHGHMKCYLGMCTTLPMS